MSSTQTITEKGSVMGSIRSMARRLSGTFIGQRSQADQTGKEKKPPLYSYDDDTGVLKIGKVPVTELAEKYGTPLYVYDVDRMVDNFNLYLKALQASVTNNNFLLSYAVKANPSIGLLDLFKRLGAKSGTDESGVSHVAYNCISGGEIARVASIGVDLTTSVIFSGIGKTKEEIETAVKQGVYVFNIESWHELENVEAAARKYNREVNISIRVNPEINLSGGHEGASAPSQYRFGVSLSDTIDMAVRAKASAYLRVKGLSVQLQLSGVSFEPYIEARDKLLVLAETLRSESKIFIEHINLGGGFPLGLGADLTGWIEKLAKPIAERGLRVILCPGRSIVSDAGVLVSRVSLVKKASIPVPGSGSSSPRRGSITGLIGSVPSSPISPNAPMNFDYNKTVSLTGRDTGKPKGEHSIKQFAVLDTSVFDFGGLRSLAPTIAPDFRVVPGQVRQRLLPVEFKYDIVGATTEAGDIFARDYPLAEELISGESLVVFTDAGAYAFSFAGNYASRNRPGEVLVSGDQAHLIRERESYEEQFGREKTVREELPLTGTGLRSRPGDLKEESPTEENK